MKTRKVARVASVKFHFMSSEISDEIVIKKKRRRRTAVDPCLGYYRNDGDFDVHSSDAPTTYPHRAVYKKEGIQATNDDAVQENEKQQNFHVVSSDYAQAITSPLPDCEDAASAAAAITVEDFLRQQASANANTPRRRFRKTKTYSCKRRRKAQFSGSSEDEDEDDEMADLPILNNATSKVIKSSSSPRIITLRARRAKQRQERKALSSSTTRKRKSSTSRTGTAFSKRIQRAALLSAVDPDLVMDFGCTPVMPAPLRLVPRDKIPPRSSRTPIRDKRVKLVNPCISRPIDTSFANKENAPLLSVQVPNKNKKACKPFLQWNCPPGPFPQTVPRTPVSSPLASKSSRNQSMRLGIPNPTSMMKIITPLQLVPYEEHDKARSAKFDKRLSRTRTGCAATPVPIPIPPLILRSNSQDPAFASVSALTSVLPAPAPAADVEDDPFQSLPLPLTPTTQPSSRAVVASRAGAGAGSALQTHASTAFQPEELNNQDNEDIEPVKQTSSSFFLSAFPPEAEVLVPQTSESLCSSISAPPPARMEKDSNPRSHSLSHLERNMNDTDVDSALQTHASDSSNATNDINAITSPDLERPYSASTPGVSAVNDIVLATAYPSSQPDSDPRKMAQQSRRKTEPAQAQTQTQTQIRTPRPMRRIGTMLDGLRERARSVLLTQTQTQIQTQIDPQRQRQHRHLSHLPSVAALPLESAATRTRTQVATGSSAAVLSHAHTRQDRCLDLDLDRDRDLMLARRARRASSRRLVFSSPVRYSDRRLTSIPVSTPAPVPAFISPSITSSMAQFTCAGPRSGIEVDEDALGPGRSSVPRAGGGGIDESDDGDGNEDIGNGTEDGEIRKRTKAREFGSMRMKGSVSAFLGQIFEESQNAYENQTEQGESQRWVIRSSPWPRPLPVPMSASASASAFATESLFVPRCFPASEPRTRARARSRSRSRFPTGHINAKARPSPCPSSMIQTTGLASIASTTDKLPASPSLLFDYHNGLPPPNLFDLLEDAERQRAGAQIILSSSS